jgi:hypothetical protein
LPPPGSSFTSIRKFTPRIEVHIWNGSSLLQCWGPSGSSDAEKGKFR